ncbi:lipid droplet phospholipase 1 isoform X2 [Cryptomeria japonica]|uniref:lipid droplet phospholipase 1 isoform X2 n=1 Tax=Cryptomeria japonica TaxID=3369 RepID=UPI0025ABA177|nr:lipid droplet phospholipase 1 isoform X2 [Cryptomeria japonica]
MASEAELCESENGGQHLLMAKESGEDKPVRDHLIVMVNGIGGSAGNWKFASDQFVKKFPDKVIVHCSERNASRLTLDGVDVMGERLADEVDTVTKCNPGLKKISFISHSVGGLVARYSIGRLYEPPSSDKITLEHKELPNGNIFQYDKEQSSGMIAGLEPVNFITVATPHLGSKGKKQVPFLFGLPLLEKVACLGVHIFIGRTGRHLFLTDNHEGKLPLLRRMLNDCGDLYFMSALRAFKCRIAYSNVAYDHIVGWRTSSIRLESQLPKLQDPIDERYPHIVNVEDENDNSHKPRSPVSKEDHSVNPEEAFVDVNCQKMTLVTCVWKLSKSRHHRKWWQASQRYLGSELMSVFKQANRDLMLIVPFR